MTLSEMNRKDLIIHNTEKAFSTQREVEFLIKNKYYSLALNRIYYGMFYIISAIAIKNGFSTSNHSQIIGWFNKNYVKEKKVDRKIGRMIYRAFEQRMKSDYNILHKFTLEDAKIGLSNLKEVIQSINELLNNE
ncbi:MAG: HEPN domain-containing protein [Candidatus Cloacimonadota bacterium]|nr:HEPN domain-containing protein [Candidatus Cloacimonadota bacterium]